MKYKINNEVECPYCEKPLEEVFQSFCDADDNEAEGMIGYNCVPCDIRFNLHLEEI